MSPCPSSPHLSSALRTGYDSSHAEVSGLMTRCKAASHAVRHWGLPSHVFIWCFCLTWELPALPSSCFAWYRSRFPDTELLETLHKQTWLAETWIGHALASDMGCWTGQGAALANSFLLPVLCHSSKCVISSWGSHKAWGLSPPSRSRDRWPEASGSCWSGSVGTEPVCEQPYGSSRWSVFQCARLWQPLASA